MDATEHFMVDPRRRLIQSLPSQPIGDPRVARVSEQFAYAPGSIEGLPLGSGPVHSILILDSG